MRARLAAPSRAGDVLGTARASRKRRHLQRGTREGLNSSNSAPFFFKAHAALSRRRREDARLAVAHHVKLLRLEALPRGRRRQAPRGVQHMLQRLLPQRTCRRAPRRARVSRRRGTAAGAQPERRGRAAGGGHPSDRARARAWARARARDETCPVSTEGWTRLVHFVREGGEGAAGGGHPSDTRSSARPARLDGSARGAPPPMSRVQRRRPAARGAAAAADASHGRGARGRLDCVLWRGVVMPEEAAR
jgi:hypothetical protein